MKNSPPLFPPDRCTGCMTCIEFCSPKALKPVIDEYGILRVKLDNALCIHCNRCSDICPVLHAASWSRPKEEPLVFAAWAKEQTIRQQGATAGIFGALAAEIVRNGGCAFGAVQEGVRVLHRCCETSNELSFLQGSKYQQGNITGIHAAVLALLKNGRTVLFSGVPCQVAGLLAFLKNKNYSGTCLTVDLICGGFSSAFPMDFYLAKHPDFKEIVSFRDKKEGWKPSGYRYNLTVRTQNNDIVCQGDNNLVIAAFSSHLFHRPSCEHCQFGTYTRQSDLTIGDFWGDQQHITEHFNGVSAVIVHSSQGMKLLQNSRIHLEPASIEKLINSNPRLLARDLKTVSVSRLEKRIAYKLLRFSMKHNRDFISFFLKLEMKLLSLRYRLMGKKIQKNNFHIAAKIINQERT